MSANLKKVQNALHDLEKKKVLLNPLSYACTRHRQVDSRPSATRTQASRPKPLLLNAGDSCPRRNTIKWLEDLQRQILPLNHTTLRELVVQLLHENDDFKPLGQHWTTRFLERHPSLQTSHGRPMDIQRLLALDPNIITTYFNIQAGWSRAGLRHSPGHKSKSHDT